MYGGGVPPFQLTQPAFGNTGAAWNGGAGQFGAAAPFGQTTGFGTATAGSSSCVVLVAIFDDIFLI